MIQDRVHSFPPSAPTHAPNRALRPASAAGSADDGAAFEELFRSYRDPLRRFLVRKLRSQDDADDALAHTFYKAWRARHSFRGEVCQEKWLFGIANRVAIDIIRGRTRRGPEEPLDPERLGVEVPDDTQGDPAHLFLTQETRVDLTEAVHRAARRLSPDQRRLLQLYYFDGKQYQEISSLLGVPYTSLRGRLHAIRQILRRDLGGTGGRPGQL